jgi:carboxypeptidase T
MSKHLGAAVAALTVAALLASAALAVEADLATMRARLEFASQAEWEQFLATPGLDVMMSKKGVGATIITNADEVERLRSMGFKVVVEVEDLPAYYRARMPRDDFGQYHTYSETVDALDLLHATYPGITTAKDSIGCTEEGRALWVMKISDNPDLDESEPEVFIDGLHHAREPITIECILHYMEWLCENYGTDPEATYLVDNREIWFFPVVNPDGYAYNESVGWGNMWRKNRRVNPGTSCLGVDNNRNYDWQWGTTGISFDECNNLYCGPEAFSELENQTYRDFVMSRDFVLNISFHSVVGCILVPWGYDDTITPPDDALFRDIGAEMAKYNGYSVGTAGDILNYVCSGTTCDWMYGARDILSLCIEVGGSDFWPTEGELPGLRAENLWPQQYVTRIAGSYLALRETYALIGGDGDGEPDAGETLDLAVTIDNQGIAVGATNASVTLLTDDSYVRMNDAYSSLGTIAALDHADNSTDPFSFELDAATPEGHALTMTLVIEADDFYAEEEFVWIVGEPTLLFSDDMESGSGNWVENDGNWGLTTSQSNSPITSYTDSPVGMYANNRNTWIELADPIDLSGAIAAELRFWHYANTEALWDFCYVEGSTDGGATWLEIGPRYDGDIPWRQETLSLNDFTGTADFKVRFRFNSDTYVTDDGWYVDDVEIYGPPTGNDRPTAPTLSDPPYGGTVSSSTPTLTVLNATDADVGDVLTYGFTVYSDELCTAQVASAAGVAEGSVTTAWIVDSSLADGTYYWRVYADDGTERGPLMETGSFTVESTGLEDGVVSSVVLHRARPNPFASETLLSFEMPAREAVTFSIYSVDGRLVRRLVEGQAGPGPVEVVWDGRDDRGLEVGSGLYFMRPSSGRTVELGKLVVLR